MDWLFLRLIRDEFKLRRCGGMSYQGEVLPVICRSCTLAAEGQLRILRNVRFPAPG
jgi:hypothetical protein